MKRKKVIGTVAIIVIIFVGALVWYQWRDKGPDIAIIPMATHEPSENPEVD